MSSAPPAGLPAYRLLTGPDDAAFCHRVSDALAAGYELYGQPAVALEGTKIVVAQAVIWRPDVVPPASVPGTAAHAGP